MATTISSAKRVRETADNGVVPPPGTAHLSDLASDHDGWGLHPIGGADTGLGGHKDGYGLSLMVGLLSNAVSMAADASGSATTTRQVGHGFVAIDPRRFGPGFPQRASAIAELLRTASDDPTAPVRVPGDRAHRALATGRELGVPVAPNTMEEVREIAERANAAFLLASVDDVSGGIG